MERPWIQTLGRFWRLPVIKRKFFHCGDALAIFRGGCVSYASELECLGSTAIGKVAGELAALERHPARKIAASCGEGLSHMSKIGKWV